MTRAPEETDAVDGVVVRVLPDVAAIDKEFDYLAEGPLPVGTMVRVPLHGRRVGGWVTASAVEPPAGLELARVAKISGLGPSAEMMDLCAWAAWRWAGRRATFLRAGSPPTMVRSLPARRGALPTPAAPAIAEVASAFDRPRTVLRLPPTADVVAVVLTAAARGDTLVVAPTQAAVAEVAVRLRRAGVPTAVFPRDWAQAAAGGCVVVGARGAAFAPMPTPAAFVILDEHDEALQHEASPTWHAREVVLERARRARVPAVMCSPCPSLESTARSPLVTVARRAERDGWPRLEIIDRRRDERPSGLFSEPLVRALRVESTVVCVLNRTGRARLLSCATCGEVTRCERCDAAVVQPTERELACPRCGAVRPVVCAACGGTTLKRLRLGVSRAREELEALLREPVVEVTAGRGVADVPPARVHLGTEAVLHQVPRAAVVAFLDFDQELLAPRYRAAEEALALVVRAARLVGGRGDGDAAGKVVVQTRVPDHEVLRAALYADPGIVAEAEATRRERFGFPPAVTMAVVGGPAAPEYLARLGHPLGVEVSPSGDVTTLIARDRAALLDALAATERPSGRLRLQIDPMRWH